MKAAKLCCILLYQGYTETGHLTHSVCLNYCNCLLSGPPASSVHSLHGIQNCAAHLILKKGKTDHITHLFQQTLTAINVSWALLHLFSLTVFNFTHPPVLSTLLLILSASRFLTPVSPLFVPTPFLSSVHLNAMTFPSSPTETLSGFVHV